MPSVSNIAVGAAMAGAAAQKARHQMNESIARLSTGIRSMYGGDAAGQSIANSLGAKGASFAVAARNAEDGISFLQSAESLLLEVAALTTRLRELGIQYANKDLLTTTDEAALDAEATAIGDAIQNIAENVKFNGVRLIGETPPTVEVKFQLVLMMEVILQPLVQVPLSLLLTQALLLVQMVLTEVLIQHLVKSLNHLVTLLLVCLRLKDTKLLQMFQRLT